MEFFPGKNLDQSQQIEPLSIKGIVPCFDYPFRLVDIYATVPSLDTKSVRRIILNKFIAACRRIDRRTGQNRVQFWKNLQNVRDNAIVFSTLLHPSISVEKTPDGEKVNQFLISNTHPVYPYPWAHASPRKLMHSLYWIDCNIKTKIESIALGLKFPREVIINLVESALLIYSYLIKMNDYALARTMNFNFSIYLQDRIIALLFGETLIGDTEKLITKGKLSNEMALNLLKQYQSPGIAKLIEMSTYMGVVWHMTEEIQHDYQAQPDSALLVMEKQLQLRERRWAVRDIDDFLKDIEAHRRGIISVILDDNGESVCDLAIFQQVYTLLPEMEIRFVVNRFPISNNIAIEILEEIIQDSYFAVLRRAIQSEKIKILLEEQKFRSFEIGYLQPETMACLKKSDLIYIKGANFFETFQLPQAIRYHCFTIWGAGSIQLTGYDEGQGVFVRLAPGDLGFSVQGSDQIITLKNVVNKRRKIHA